MDVSHIKLSQLRHFVTVADMRSVKQAAHKLGRTPPAISMSLKSLEATLGHPLFEGEDKSRPTPLGAFVYDLAKDEIERHDKNMRTVMAMARNEIGQVDIAAVPSFANRRLPGLIAAFATRHPGVRISVRDDTADTVLALVERGAVDFGIASLDRPYPIVAFEPIESDPIGVVCSRNHPLASGNGKLRWSDLEGFPFIANGTCRLIDAPGFQPSLEAATLSVANTTSILAMVASGVGITTLPRLALPEPPGNIVFRHVAGRALVRRLGLISMNNRTLSPAGQAMYDLIRGADRAA